MKEEALKKGEELLRRKPELKTKTDVFWSNEGSGPSFIMLFELLRGNAIPTTKLGLSCDDNIMKNK